LLSFYEISSSELRNWRVDAALAALAVDTASFSSETMALSYLTLAESVVHSRGWRAVNHDELIAPVLDRIVTQYRGVTAPTASVEAMTIARVWMRPSVDYHALVGGIMNYLQERMRCVRTDSGRVIFYPISSFEAELRNRWFLERRNQARELAGRAILADNDETKATLRRIDTFIKSRDEDFYNGRCSAPDDAWYQAHCDGFADRALVAMFDFVENTEVWSGMSKDQTIRAIRPLFVRAARRFVVHSRACARAKHEGAAGPVFMTCIETATKTELSREIAASGSLSSTEAEAFVNSLIRKGRDERHGILPYPLIPIGQDRVVVVPSVILFSAWPHARERVLAKSNKGNVSISKARNRRHTNTLKEAFTASGVKDVVTEVVLYDKDCKQHITDLDVVAVDGQRKKVLVLQLKSFLTPAHLLEVDRADEDVADAIRQCKVADDNLNEAKRRIEDATGLTLEPDWKLLQVIVVEAVTGTAQPDNRYPAVSIEWAVDAINRTSGDFETFWRDARDLPDASAFRERIRPAFELFDTHLRDLKTGTRIAVFAYGS